MQPECSTIYIKKERFRKCCNPSIPNWMQYIRPTTFATYGFQNEVNFEFPLISSVMRANNIFGTVETSSLVAKLNFQQWPRFPFFKTHRIDTGPPIHRFQHISGNLSPHYYNTKCLKRLRWPFPKYFQHLMYKILMIRIIVPAGPKGRICFINWNCRHQ